MKNETRKAILAQIDEFLQNANRLPQKKDAEVLKRFRAIWAVSGSGSYLKPLIDTASDQANLDNPWYHGTDKARLDYAERWLVCYSKILPDNPPPTLIYNGLKEQVEDLFTAIKKKKYKIPKSQIYIAPGQNIRTLDQVKNFSFPPNLNLANGILGVLSHAPHLARILRFMGRNHQVFKDIKVIALPLTLENQSDQIKMIEPEVKGILDYIQKDEASPNPYPYELMKEKK